MEYEEDNVTEKKDLELYVCGKKEKSQEYLSPIEIWSETGNKNIDHIHQALNNIQGEFFKLKVF